MVLICVLHKRTVCIHNIHFNSTIFTTKNKELAIFGNTIDDVKDKIDKFNEARKKGNWFGENGAFASLFSNKKSNILSPEVLSQFDEFKEKFNSTTLSAEALAEQFGEIDQRIIEYAKTCKNGEMTTDGFKASVEGMSFSAKAGAVALKALSIAGNMLAGWAISKVIELTVKGIDNLAHSAEKAEESAKNLSATMRNSIGSISSNASTLSKLKAEYQELSEGVNKLGGNVNLSTEQYNRYKDVVDQISSIMPNLTTYFNDQGEKIAFAKGELKDLNEEYENYIQKQALKFVTKGDDDGNTIQKILDTYNNNESYKGFENFWKMFKSKLGFVDIENFSSKQIISELEKLRTMDSVQEIADYLNSYDKELGAKPDLTRPESALKYVLLEKLGLNAKDKKEIQAMTEEDYNAVMQNIIGYIHDYKLDISSDMQDIQTAIIQSMYSKDAYWELEKELRNNVSTLLSSIDSDIWDELNIRTDHDLNLFINNVIDAIADNEGGFADAWNGLFSPDINELPLKECSQKINEFLETVCKTLGLDIENGKPLLKISLGLDVYEDTYKKLQNSIRQITDDHGITDRDEYAYLMDEIDFDSFTQAAQVELWLEATRGAENAAQAIQMYNDVLKKVKKESVPLSDIFSLENADDELTALGKLSGSIDTIQNAYKTLYTAIDEYNKEGAFSIDTLQSVIALGDDWLDYLVDEEGKLKLDKESLEQLTEARLKDMRFQAINNIIDNVDKIMDEASANEYLASTNYALAESYEKVAQETLVSKRAQLQAAVDAGDLVQETMDAVMDKAYADIAKINKLFNNVDLSADSMMGSKSSSSTDSYKEAFEKELKEIEYLRDKDVISEAEYYQRLKDLNEQYFAGKEKYLDEYRKYEVEVYKYEKQQEEAFTDQLDKFQSSVKSASDAYATLLSGHYSSSELLDSIQDISQAVKDMGELIDWEVVTMSANPLQTIQNTIEAVSSSYANSILSGAGIDVDSKFGKMLANIVQEAYEAEARFKGMNAQLDRLQDSYKTLTDVLESYNETGYISLDSLQSLLTADENLISMLKVENGQLVINQSAYENLVSAQLKEFKVKLDNAAAAEIEALALNKAEEATNSNARASENAVTKLNAETEAFNRNTSAAIANAMTKAENAGVSDAEIQGVLQKYSEIWNAAMDNYSGDFSSFMNAGKEAGETFKEALEKELDALDSKMDAGYMDFSSYIQARLSLIESYYSQAKISAADYYSFLSSHYSQQLSYMGMAVKAVTRRIDKQISSLNKQKENINNNYQSELKYWNSRKDALEAEKEALQEANEERKNQTDLQKELYNLERAQNQRTKLVKYLPDAIVI